MSVTDIGDLGVDALVGHDAVHEGEAAAGLGSRPGVGHEEVNAVGELVGDLTGLLDGFLGHLRQVLRESCAMPLLLVEPGGVGGGDGPQPGFQLGGCGGGEVGHVEFGALKAAGGDGWGFDEGQPVGAHARGSASARGPAPGRGAGASDGELEAVAVLEGEALVLDVLVGQEFRGGGDVADGEEGARSVGIDGQ